jgi:hypothetical protein
MHPQFCEVILVVNNQVFDPSLIVKCKTTRNKVLELLNRKWGTPQVEPKGNYSLFILWNM